MREKTTSDDKRKHLEFIQDVINRLSSNTFLFKGWSITIIVAVFTAIVTTQNYNLVWLNLGAVLIFWLIDAYYLMLEQAYRKLYNEVTDTDVEKIDYKMSVKQFVGFSAWLAAFRRPVLLMFYGAILAVIIYIIFYNNFEICLIIKVKE
ncbi:MAG: hypothetical protein HXL11_01345 [Candidatus Nanosynbacter sp.]|nr:hypothetical protein [Candidatus Nanosynbacter sp.]